VQGGKQNIKTKVNAMRNNIIHWGILGVGDVCEVKTGPAFQKAQDSELVAVMRRSTLKAQEFARRHRVPRWYDTIDDLLADKEIDAIYISTPPKFHLEHTQATLDAGKMVYLEKPMGLNADECKKIIEKEKQVNKKVVVAHYRRALPLFEKVGELLRSGAVGTPRLIEINILQSAQSSLIADVEGNWRMKPEISGGGLFHDLAPHMIDLVLQFFGDPATVNGFSLQQQENGLVDDFVHGAMIFESGAVFTGNWGFTVSETAERDSFVITGDEGQVSCSFFGDEVIFTSKDGVQAYTFPTPDHVQQPMVEIVNRYFMGLGKNPCSTLEALRVVEIMDVFSAPLKK
jgi:1,5-anhydro-D-fructose reductase (1,5-anhydro-D-mannitol-forming)